MGLDLEYVSGQTPIDDDEKDGLKISTITLRGELDEFEQQNIETALQWIMSRSFSVSEIFSIEFIRNLHRRMFSDVWKWAGEFRLTNKNIGADKYQIGIELKVLLDDGMYWFNNNTYAPDEIAIRFSHRLVAIHCFPNGNGRHSRLMADIIIEKIFHHQLFSWGSESLIKPGEARAAYLMALRHADEGDVSSLIKFARS
jgi:Fic-DOC domain mobile mystery protein B